jgi:O-antigen/teichoic acid export membrane protein
MATTFISLFFTQFDKLLLSKILSLKDFGNYSFAVMISNILIVMINPINQAHFPKYSELISKNNKKKLITVFHQATQLAISICGTAAFVLFFFGDKLISAWSQNFTLATSTFPILKILIIGSFFYCIHRIVFSILLAHGWSNLTTRINVIGITFFIPTMLWASFSYQALGAAWAWLVLNFGIFILSSIIFFKRALKSEKNKWYITDILIPASSSFLTLLCFSFLINNFANQILQVIFIIIFSTIAFSISLICSIDLRIIIKNYFYALKNYLAK